MQQTLLLASAWISALHDIIPAEPSELKLGFVATATEPLSDAPWVAAGQSQLRSKGYEVVPVNPSDDIESFDIIYVTGGNTYYLLQQIRHFEFDRALTEFIGRGGIYVGASAGSIIMGPDIDITGEPDQKSDAPNLSSTKGLNMVPFAVLPHAGVDTPRFLEHHSKVLNTQSSSSICRITDNEAVLVHNGETSIVWSPREP